MSLRNSLTPLQDRFFNSGFEGLDDRGVIELLLNFVLSARESKKLAKVAVERFGNLSGVIAASSEELARIGFPPKCILGVKVIHDLPAEVLKQRISGKPVYASSEEIFHYLYYSMRDLKKEIFKIIYLNNRSQIIDIVDAFDGEVDSVHIYPRKIVRYALRDNATALIFVHNHPSGDPSPSKRDKKLTRDLVYTGEILQISVLDHLIIGDNAYFSFADEGLVGEYRLDFLNLKLRNTSEAKRRLNLARVLNGKMS
jgi:DNA repair protein RadC